MKQELENLDQFGFFVRPSIVESNACAQLAEALEYAVESCREIQQRTGAGEFASPPEPSLGGAAHHLPALNPIFSKFLEQDLAYETIEAYLGGKLILNNYGGLVNTKTSDYSHGLSIHRDVRTADANYGKQMVIVLVALDEFTAQNGATLYLPGSHQSHERPNEDHFRSHAKVAEMPAGSILVFDARLWHAAGHNSSDTKRRALTIGFTRPFFKPQFDYCRCLSHTDITEFSPELRQLIGFNSRIPANLDEWYQPRIQRFYKGDG